jgi:hypothetical protein
MESPCIATLLSNESGGTEPRDPRQGAQLAAEPVSLTSRNLSVNTFVNFELS